MENTHNGKNKGKLSTSHFIMVHHQKIVDPFFLYQIGWIKPKPFQATVPLSPNWQELWRKVVIVPSTFFCMNYFSIVHTQTEISGLTRPDFKGSWQHFQYTSRSVVDRRIFMSFSLTRNRCTIFSSTVLRFQPCTHLGCIHRLLSIFSDVFFISN